MTSIATSIGKHTGVQLGSLLAISVGSYQIWNINSTYVRKGIRSAKIVTDIAISEMAFTGVENTDWVNVKSTNL